MVRRCGQRRSRRIAQRVRGCRGEVQGLGLPSRRVCGRGNRGRGKARRDVRSLHYCGGGVPDGEVLPRAIPKMVTTVLRDGALAVARLSLFRSGFVGRVSNLRDFSYGHGDATRGALPDC